jgi:DNA topoisomerase 2-associated protein PAT1
LGFHLVKRRISFQYELYFLHELNCLIDDDWQEAHERLAELEEKLPMAVNEQTGNGERDEMDLLGDHEENLAERLSKMVIENELEDPAIMRAVQTRPVLQVSKLL